MTADLIQNSVRSKNKTNGVGHNKRPELHCSVLPPGEFNDIDAREVACLSRKFRNDNYSRFVA